MTIRASSLARHGRCSGSTEQYYGEGDRKLEKHDFRESTTGRVADGQWDLDDEDAALAGDVSH